jgi:hypothetical protein
MYFEAEPHFLAGTAESSKAYGKMLAEWSEKDHPLKRGAYIARAVLQYVLRKCNLHIIENDFKLKLFKIL